MTKKVILLLIFLLPGSYLLAEDKLNFIVSQPVMNNEQNNLTSTVKEKLTSTLSKNISYKISESKTPCFSVDCAAILSRNQSNTRIIITQIIFTPQKSKEQISKYLSQVQQNDKYQLNIKVINPLTSTVELTYTRKGENEEIINKEAYKIAKEIDAYYKASSEQITEDKTEAKQTIVSEPASKNKKQNNKRGLVLDLVTAGLITMKPVGTYKEYGKTGLGINSQAAFKFIAHPSLKIFAGLQGIYLFEPKPSIKTISLINIKLGFGYQFNMGNVFFFRPSFYYNHSMHLINGDKDGADASGNYKYTDAFYHNPGISSEFTLGFNLHKKVNLTLVPYYFTYFGSGNINMAIGGSINIEYKF